MNTPTVTLCSLPLCTSLPLFLPFLLFQCDSICPALFSIPVLVSPLWFPALPLCLSDSSPVVHSPLSAPDCENALLWQFCCRALLTCMSCCIAMSSPMAPPHPNVLRVRAVLPQQRGNAERMLHLRCGQDYLKNLLKPVLHFYHFCSFCTSYWRSVKYCAEGFEWSHVCLEYLFVFSAEPSDMSAELISFFCKSHIIIIQVLPNHHHYDWCFYIILHLDFLCVQMLAEHCWYPTTYC